jgi:Bacterial Ig-like domain
MSFARSQRELDTQMTGSACKALSRIGLPSAFLGAVCLLLLPSLAHATGLGNLTYTQDELEKPIANFGGEGASKWASGPTGSNTVMMLRDVFLVMGSNDSGAPPGSFHFYDIKDPRNPKLLKTYDGTPETSHLRELHAMPMAMIDGKDMFVFPSTTGLQFFDFTDPMNPAPSGSIKLKGDNAGDYDNATWMLSWTWPYVFAGSTGAGVFVVDATDPAKPTLVSTIASGELGNFRVGPTYAAGNSLIVANMDQTTTHFSVIAVGAPTKHFLLATTQVTSSLYSSLVVGDRIYGAGTNGDYVFMKWNTTAISSLKAGKNGTDRGGYCTYQSGFTICGQSSEGYKKWDTTDENAPKLVGHGTDPNGTGGDFDFATVLGNLVYLGNDHGTGAALVPHSMAPDTTAPEVVKIYPSNGDTKQPLSTRITVFFSEDIDLGTVNATNLIVRKNGETAPLDGVFSRSSFNAISFGFKQPLTANTTYEVMVPKSGLKDLVGNVIGTDTTVRFSTGPTVDNPIVIPDPSGGAAGMGGMSATAGGPANMGGVAGMSGGNGPSGGAPVTAMAGEAMMMPAGGSGTTGGSTPNGAASNTDPAGCGCSVPGRSPPSGLLLLPAALWLGLRSRVRRRASRASPPAPRPSP